MLFRLQALKIGQALESGVAIVLMAITLDQLSRAAAYKEPSRVETDATLLQRFPFLSASTLVVVASLVLAAITPYAQTWPSDLALSTAPFWDALVDWVTVTFYDPLQYLRNAMLLYVLIPVRDLFQSIPWTAMVALVAAAGWAAEKLSRPKLKEAGGTGLGDLESLELLALGIMGKAMLWRALGTIEALHGVISDADCRRLEARARVQFESIERLRMQTAQEALAETEEPERAHE